MLLLLLAACDSSPTDICRARRLAVDEVYTRYGGSKLAKATEGGVLGDAVGELDRARIEAACVELGRGGRPVVAGKKAKDFFADPEVREACERVVDLDDALAAKNRTLPADQQGTCP